MNVDELLNTARESLTVRRVYGDPVEKDGVTVIPAASVAGGFGGGRGTEPEGEGGGFGMRGRPAGVYVVKDGQVAWRPAVDVNRLAGVVGMAVVTYLLMRPRMARIRAAAR